jgi:zinc/manganese transport system ATP-binding protein
MDAHVSPAIRLTNLTLGYSGRAAVHHLDCAIPAGSLLAVVGPNGSGKTTLLKGIAGLLKPLEGRVLITGARQGRAAYLPQQARIDQSFPINVGELVSLGLWRRIGLFGALKAADREVVAGALQAVGLEGFEKRQIGTLSGGQMQRVLFARVLVEDSDLILLDEPFSGIDQRTLADLMGVIDRWRAEQRTVVAVLHDYELVRSRFPMTLVLAREKVAFGPTDEVLTRETLKRADALAEGWDETAPFCERV